jgi:DNA-binding FrmR family transcriptional regulator
MEGKTKKSIQTKLKKAQWQLARVQTMIEEDEYCIDIVQQNMAVIWLLKSAQQDILQNHLNSCFVEWVAHPRRRDAMIEELVKVFNYYNK